jgi:2-C-methyl-D-erythritol 4-phosphate cytidylyltransferase
MRLSTRSAVILLLAPLLSSAFVVSSNNINNKLSSTERLNQAGTTFYASSGDSVDMSDVGFVLLAGGTGSRMKANLPKQFLELKNVPILHHSLHLFLEELPQYLTSYNCGPPPHVVLVMDPMYQPEYQSIVDRYAGQLSFANPGKERQGSVENGLQKLIEISNNQCKYAAIHDSARPLVTIDEIVNVVKDAKQFGAAVLGVPCKATIKESEDGRTVLRTIPRARLWEVHTPQVVRTDTLLRGFAKVAAENLEVTDDVSIVEALGETVKLTLGEYTNLKITTPEDMEVAGAILEERGTVPVDMWIDDSRVVPDKPQSAQTPPPYQTVSMQEEIQVIGEPSGNAFLIMADEDRRNWHEGTGGAFSVNPESMRIDNSSHGDASYLNDQDSRNSWYEGTSSTFQPDGMRRQY